MNRETILAMEPGRELNELVATRVLGWKREDYAGYPDESMIPDWVDDGFIMCAVEDFDPSSDISAAWEVVEKFPLFEVTRIEHLVGNVSHEAKVWCDLEEGTTPCEIAAKTAPLVICRAALIAVLGESI